ncbi:MAG: hypothetical protein RLZ92_546 [Pseudomonadota bacterium]|jgi:hypothetical protein
MIKPLQQTTRNNRSNIKKWLLIALIASITLMPETLIHLLAVIAHTVYETIAFAIEEVLVHGVGLSKFYAQMIVFYGSLAIAGMVTIILIRRLPSMLAYTRTRTTESYAQLRADLINRWQLLPNQHKIQIILMQLVAMISMMALVLS